MNNNRLDQLKQDYMNTPIPRELDFVVRKALQQTGKRIISKRHVLQPLP